MASKQKSLPIKSIERSINAWKKYPDIQKRIIKELENNGILKRGKGINGKYSISTAKKNYKKVDTFIKEFRRDFGTVSSYEKVNKPLQKLLKDYNKYPQIKSMIEDEIDIFKDAGKNQKEIYDYIKNRYGTIDEIETREYKAYISEYTAEEIESYGEDGFTNYVNQNTIYRNLTRELWSKYKSGESNSKEFRQVFDLAETMDKQEAIEVLQDFIKDIDKGTYKEAEKWKSTPPPFE